MAHHPTLTKKSKSLNKTSKTYAQLSPKIMHQIYHRPRYDPPKVWSHLSPTGKDSQVIGRFLKCSLFAIQAQDHKGIIGSLKTWRHHSESVCRSKYWPHHPDLQPPSRNNALQANAVIQAIRGRDRQHQLDAGAEVEDERAGKVHQQHISNHQWLPDGETGEWRVTEAKIWRKWEENIIKHLLHLILIMTNAYWPFVK